MRPIRDIAVESNTLKIDRKDWHGNEIALLRRAVELIPKEHWDILSKLKFVWVTKLPTIKTGNADAAEYYPTDPPLICITDKVVDPQYDEYLYDAGTDEVAPKGVRLIVHEVGHAVSIERWRKTAFARKSTGEKSVAELESLGGTKAISAKPISDLDEFIDRHEYVTDYAASEMAAGDRDTARSELFAEAYSMWIAHPDYMRRNHKRLADWFDKQTF